MPRGVYPRKPKPKGRPRKQRPANNGNLPEFNVAVEDLDAIALPSPQPHTGGNGQRWGNPYEADAREFERKDNLFERLYEDAMLRLEQTPASKAIVYPFETDHAAERAYEGLRRRVRIRNGADAVRSGVRRNPPRVFVRRGPRWKS